MDSKQRELLQQQLQKESEIRNRLKLVGILEKINKFLVLDDYLVLYKITCFFLYYHIYMQLDNSLRRSSQMLETIIASNPSSLHRHLSTLLPLLLSLLNSPLADSYARKLCHRLRVCAFAHRDDKLLGISYPCLAIFLHLFYSMLFIS